jgi:hypothetical protein
MESMKSPDPIAIPPEIAAKCDAGGDQFDRFDRLFRAVVAVPKATLEKRERAWKRKQERKRASRSDAKAKP